MSLAHTSFLPVARLNFQFFSSFQYQPTDEVIFNTSFLVYTLFFAIQHCSCLYTMMMMMNTTSRESHYFIYKVVHIIWLFFIFIHKSHSHASCLELSSSYIARLDMPATWKIYFSWTRWWAVISVNVFFF